MALPPISPSGVSTAFQYPTQTSAGAGIAPILAALPGDTNAPVIFEPGPQLTGNQLEVWVIATGADPNWGGCQVWVSADNTSYGAIGSIGRGAVQGVLTATFPSGADPDTTDTLAVDLTESQGTMTGTTAADADAHLSLAYVDGELVSYSAATLTGANHYSMGTYIRRGVYGSPIGAHAIGSQFALALGAFVHSYPANLIGTTIYLKFPSFNTVGGNLQDLSTVAAYSYVLTGNGQSPVASGIVTIHRVTSGTSDTLGALTSVITVSDWSSAAAGAKTQTIPAASGNDSRMLCIKMKPAVTGTMTITPAGGTIEGASSVNILAPDDLWLLADGTANNWDVM